MVPCSYDSTLTIAVICTTGQDRPAAARLARELGVTVSEAGELSDTALVLELSSDGLELHDRRQPGVRGLSVDFNPPAGRYRSFPIPRRGPFAQALGRRTCSVIDATAGWGEDAARMAWMGLRVIAVERNPVMAALLNDARARLERETLFKHHGLHLPRVVAADATAYLGEQGGRPDCIYLDPMFPPKRKSSALAARPLRLLRELTGDDTDAAMLFTAAARATSRRVVVKRPDHAPPLVADPDESFAGKLVRYDVYLRKS